MPVHNGAQFIAEAVESVLNQSYPQCELVVIDDGSTDDTVLALEPFMSRLLFLKQEHRGSSAARNYGLSIASGDYIAFLDADDIFPPRTIEQRTARFSAAPSAGMVCSGWRIVDIEGRPVIDYRPWEEDPKLDLASLLLRKPVNVGSITCRRECIDHVGGFDVELEHAQDIDLAFQIALIGYELIWDREIGVLYRRRPGSASHSGPIEAQMMDRALDKVFGTPGLDPELRRIEPRVRYFTDLWNAWHAAQLGFVDELHVRLRQAALARQISTEQAYIEWAENFERWSERFGHRQLAVSEYYPALRQNLPNQSSSLPLTEELLEFWQLAIRPYLRGELEAGRKALAEFDNLPARTLIKWIQALIFCLPQQVEAGSISRIWADATEVGLVHGSQNLEVITLYLSVFSRGIFAGQWRSALRGLARAIRISLHPRSVGPWFRFFRSALTYLLKLPLARRGLNYT